MPRVVVLMLHGLDWQTWTERAAALQSLRDRFPAPVRVYGTSPHSTSGACLDASRTRRLSDAFSFGRQSKA